MSISEFTDWQFCGIYLPDGGKVICFTYRGQGHYVGLNDLNHNIFRLDKEGNVLWQVTRDEQGKVNWPLLDKLAQENGRAGAEHMFEAIWCKNPLTGETSFNPETGTPFSNFHWKPGMQLMARAYGIANNLYEINIETGVATNITPPGPKRPW